MKQIRFIFKINKKLIFLNRNNLNKHTKKYIIVYFIKISTYFNK